MKPTSCLNSVRLTLLFTVVIGSTIFNLTETTLSGRPMGKQLNSAPKATASRGVISHAGESNQSGSEALPLRMLALRTRK